MKALVDRSTSEVRTGSKLVEDVASKLATMLEAVRADNNLLSSIAADCGEQVTAIEAVSSAVRAIDEMTQHNAALVEQTNAAIEQTEAQAVELDGIVDTFRIPVSASNTHSEGEHRRASQIQSRNVRRRNVFAPHGNAAVAE